MLASPVTRLPKVSAPFSSSIPAIAPVQVALPIDGLVSLGVPTDDTPGERIVKGAGGRKIDEEEAAIKPGTEGGVIGVSDNCCRNAVDGVY